MKNILSLLLFIPLLVTSQIPEPEKGTYVNDQYGYLHDGQKLAINKQLRQIEDSTGVQVAIVLIPALPDRYDIEDYAREIGRKWHVGNDKKGIVYVAAIDQRKQRMEVSSNLEGVIPDIAAVRLIDGLKSYFRAQKYGDGIIHMVGQLGEKLNEAKAELNKKKTSHGWPWWVWLGLWFGSASIITFVVFQTIRKRRLKKLQEEQDKLAERLKREAAIDQAAYEHMKNKFAPSSNLTGHHRPYVPPSKRTNTWSDDPALLIIPPVIPDDPPPSRSHSRDEDNGSSYSSGSSSSSSSYGDWGSGSSDSGSSSSDSGYSGGGASSDW